MERNLELARKEHDENGLTSVQASLNRLKDEPMANTVILARVDKALAFPKPKSPRSGPNNFSTF